MKTCQLSDQGSASNGHRLSFGIPLWFNSLDWFEQLRPFKFKCETLLKGSHPRDAYLPRYIFSKRDFVFLNRPNPASFCLFSFFSQCKDKYSTIFTINEKA